MRFYTVICFLLFSLVLVGCKKNKELRVRIEGKITNTADGQAVSGATVILRYQGVNNGSFSSSFQTAASASTASDGSYSMDFVRPSATNYRFEVTSSKTFYKEVNVDADQISSSETNVRDITVDALSWLRVRLINSSPVNSADKIQFQYTSENNTCSDCCSNAITTLTGMTVDTSLVCLKVAGSYARYNYFVTKLGSVTPFTDSLYPVPYDTVSKVINY